MKPITSYMWIALLDLEKSETAYVRGPVAAALRRRGLITSWRGHNRITDAGREVIREAKGGAE